MSRHDKLLERMRQTKTGWGQDDFEALYTGFGFSKPKGGKHQKYIYEKYKLFVLVARHNDLATGYAVTAVKTIDKLLEAQAREQADAQPDKNA